MSGTHSEKHVPQEREEHVPLGQIAFDQIFLLFLLSLVLSFILYNAWGLMELLNVPVAPY